MPLYPPRSPGPSEQTHAIREVIMAAIKMRKSLTISNFTTHFTDKSSTTTIVPPGARINLKKLCKLVTLEVQKEKLDTVIIVGKRHDMRWHAYMEDYSNFGPVIYNGTDKFGRKALIKENYTKNECCLKIPNMHFLHFPQDKNSDLLEQFKEFGFQYNSKNSTLIGIASAQNLIYQNTLGFVDAGGTYLARRPIRAPSKAPSINQTFSTEKLGVDREFIREVQLHTDHPEFIQAIRQDFIQNFMNTTNFIGMHWRFNPGDILTEDFLQLNSTDEGLVTQRGAHIIGISNVALRAIYKSLKNPRFLINSWISHIESNIPKENRPKVLFITCPMNIAEILGHHLQKTKNLGLKNTFFY